jgi:hypothetical protein
MFTVLIYTAVFAQYDRVLPPLWQRPGLTYNLITDDPNLRVSGWETVVVSPNLSAKKSNRELKFMYEVGNPRYDYIVYVDGNFGIWRSLDPLIKRLERSNATLGLFAHPNRATVFEELSACLELGKITEREFALEKSEIERQVVSEQGARLWAAGCLIKKNTSPTLLPTMQTWSELFSSNALRDQFWLGEAVYRTGANVLEFEHWSKLLVPRLFLHRHRKSEGLLGLVYFQVATAVMSVLRLAERISLRKVPRCSS